MDITRFWEGENCADKLSLRSRMDVEFNPSPPALALLFFLPDPCYGTGFGGRPVGLESQLLPFLPAG